MICYKKKNQYTLSLLATIGTTLHYYIIDSECFLFYLMLFAPVFMAFPIMWNELLYSEISIRFKIPISYNFFQCIMTVTLFLFCIFIFCILIIGYVPTGYKAGHC